MSKDEAPEPIGYVRLVEEVPDVAPGDRYFIWKRGTGKLWHGESKDAGEQWAKDNNVAIDDFEGFEP